jgi:hypothetical protein
MLARKFSVMSLNAMPRTNPTTPVPPANVRASRVSPVFALALAFGLGGRERAAALLERWFPRNGVDKPR